MKKEDNLAQSSNNVQHPKRFWELDFLRGLCVLLMILDHAIQLMYFSNSDTLWDIFDMYMENPVRNFLHPVVRASFFLICGISCTLSRSNQRRGIRLMGVACFVTFVTLLASTISDYFLDATVYFGVLHMLAFAILFYVGIDFFANNIPKVGKYIPAMFGIFFIVFYHAFMKNRAGDGGLGFLPTLFGYQQIDGFVSGDYSPIFPEVGFVLIGTALGQFYKSKYKNLFLPLNGGWNKPVCQIGKHALIIYLVTPVILSAIYSVI